MTQNKYIIVFLAGAGAFFYFGADVLAKHTTWHEFATPAGMTHVFGLFSSVIVAVGAALGIDMSKIVSLFKKDV